MYHTILQLLKQVLEAWMIKQPEEILEQYRRNYKELIENERLKTMDLAKAAPLPPLGFNRHKPCNTNPSMNIKHTQELKGHSAWHLYLSLTKNADTKDLKAENFSMKVTPAQTTLSPHTYYLEINYKDEYVDKIGMQSEKALDFVKAKKRYHDGILELILPYKESTAYYF
jgi:hypothetical protein